MLLYSYDMRQNRPAEPAGVNSPVSDHVQDSPELRSLAQRPRGVPIERVQ